MLTALPGGSISGWDSAGVSFTVEGTCVLEKGTTYISSDVLLELLDLFAAR